jgi:hypothetical protein
MTGSDIKCIRNTITVNLVNKLRAVLTTRVLIRLQLFLRKREVGWN